MKYLIFATIAFIGLNATAQDQVRQHKKEHQKSKMLKNMSSEEIATLKTKKMTLDLDLTDSQQSDIYKIQLAKTEERKTKREERKKARENNSEQKNKEENSFNKINNNLDSKIAHKNEMKAILNSEQFEKWEKSQKRKSMNRKRKMRRHKRSR